MTKESPESVLSAVLERLKHPFLGTFTLGVILHNFPLFLITFTGTVGPAERIRLFEGYLGEQGMLLWRLWFDPLIFATVFTFAMVPWGHALSTVYYEFVEYQRAKISDRARLEFETDSRILIPEIQAIAVQLSRLIQQTGYAVKGARETSPKNGTCTQALGYLEKASRLSEHSLDLALGIHNMDGEKLKTTSRTVKSEVDKLLESN